MISLDTNKSIIYGLNFQVNCSTSSEIHYCIFEDKNTIHYFIICRIPGDLYMPRVKIRPYIQVVYMHVPAVRSLHVCLVLPSIQVKETCMCVQAMHTEAIWAQPRSTCLVKAEMHMLQRSCLAAALLVSMPIQIPIKRSTNQPASISRSYKERQPT